MVAAFDTGEALVLCIYKYSKQEQGNQQKQENNVSLRYKLVVPNDAGYYTSYMYIEDDTRIPWPTLKSWAEDACMLEPLGFQRGIYRTEVSESTGELVLMDMYTPLNITSYSKVVDVPDNHTACRGSHSLRHSMQGFSLAMFNVKQAHYHRHYLQMIEPYQGLWLATHAKLADFMKSIWWDKETALNAVIPSGIALVGGYPERSTWGVQLFDVPQGFETALVVPYDPESCTLSPLAEVSHLRNGYSRVDATGFLGKLAVRDLIIK